MNSLWSAGIILGWMREQKRRGDMSCINCDDNGFKIMYLHGDRVKVFCDWCRGAASYIEDINKMHDDILKDMKEEALAYKRSGDRCCYDAIVTMRSHIKHFIHSRMDRLGVKQNATILEAEGQ